jgi:hypothetical protein
VILGLATGALLAASVAVAPPSSRTGSSLLPSPSVDPSLRVRFELTTCFVEPPPAGLVPLHLKVSNDGRADREWTLDFVSTADWATRENYTSSHVVAVPAGAERAFDLLVPVRASTSTGGIATTLNVTFHGPGTGREPLTLYMTREFLHSTTTHRALSPWIGVSESLATSFWDPAKSILSARDSILLVGSRFTPGCLPADWRSYVGFGAFLLTADEWRDLPAEARGAIERWVARGGRLWLAGDTGPARPLGFGEIAPLPAPAQMNPQTVADAVAALKPTSDDYLSWGLAPRVGTPVLPKGLMLSFILGFAVVVGPVNLFAFCRGRFRHRVVWTTPAIAALAAVGLAAVILLRDGTGGAGERIGVIALLPDRHEALVLQEQVARTGLLLGGRFTAAEPVWMEPIETTPDRLRVRGHQLYGNGEAYWGDWFTSRAVQAQLVETVRPSRERFELAERAGAAPRLVSTVDDTLEQVFYVGRDGRVWKATGVDRGRAIDLQRATMAELKTWWSGCRTFLGPRLARAATWEPGMILASAAATSTRIATLPGIGWHDRQTLYLQRVP